MWWFGNAVRDRWLPTPQPLALLECRRWGIPRQSYLLRIKVDGAISLERFLKSRPSVPPDEIRRRTEQVALLLRLMHQRGVSHPAPERGGHSRERAIRRQRLRLDDPPPWLPALDGIWLTGLVGIACRFPLPRSERVQNLAVLYDSIEQDPAVSRSDLLRFLAVYLEWGLRGRAAWKTWWREVAAAVSKRRAERVR